MDNQEREEERNHQHLEVQRAMHHVKKQLGPRIKMLRTYVLIPRGKIEASITRSHFGEDNVPALEHRLQPVDHEVRADYQLRDRQAHEHLALNVRASRVNFARSVVIPRPKVTSALASPELSASFCKTARVLTVLISRWEHMGKMIRKRTHPQAPPTRPTRR